MSIRRRDRNARPAGRDPDLASIAAGWAGVVELVGNSENKCSAPITREPDETHGFPGELIETRLGSVILYALSPACRRAHHQGTDFQLPTSPMSSIAPRAMSLSRPRPRHMTMLPGGGPFAHARKPTSLAILIRYRENYPAEREWPAGSGAWQSRIHVTSSARTRDAPGSGLIRLSIVNRNSRQPGMQSIASNRTSRQRFAVAPAMRALAFRPA